MNALIAFAVRDARLAFSYPLSLLLPFGSAIVTVAGFAFLALIVNPRAPLDPGSHTTYFAYVTTNLAFMLLLNQAVQSVAQAIRRDQVAGTLEPIVASPTSLPLVVLGSSLWPMGFAAVQAMAYLGAAYAFGLRFPQIDPLALLAVLVPALTVMIAIGILIGAGVVRFRQAPPAALITGGAAALLTGVLFPVSLLPAPLRVVSWLLPLTHALHGIRGALGGAELSAVIPDALWLGIATALVLPVALAIFARALVYVRTDGTLSTY